MLVVWAFEVMGAFAMELRPEFTPPILDEAMVRRLAELADRLDGGFPDDCMEELAEFNRTARTELSFEDFDGIFRSQNHDDWVRNVLYRRCVALYPDLTREEMVEIVSRIVAGDVVGHFYLELFLANCRHPSETDLIFWPSLVPELPQDREPTVAEIADLAMRGSQAGDSD